MTYFYKQVTAMADAGQAEALEALLAAETTPWRRNILVGTLRRMAQPKAEPYAGPLEIDLGTEAPACSTEEIDWGLEPMTYSTEELLIG
jgi:hypothetical protein